MFKFFQSNCQNYYFDQLQKTKENIKIRKNISKLTDFAIDNDIQIISSFNPLSYEFSRSFKCDARGEENIKECKLPDEYVQVVPNTRAIKVWDDIPQLMFRKEDPNIFDSEYGNNLFRNYIKSSGTSAVVLYGINDSIIYTARGLLDIGVEVFIVVDACPGLYDCSTILNTLKSWNVQLVRTNFVINENGLFEIPEEE